MDLVWNDHVDGPRFDEAGRCTPRMLHVLQGLDQQLQDECHRIREQERWFDDGFAYPTAYDMKHDLRYK